MDEARKTGWFFFISSMVLFFLSWIVFRLYIFVFEIPVFPIACIIVIILLIILGVLCLLYGVWGLTCGYIQSVWQRYEDHTTKTEVVLAIKHCIKEGATPPNWLK